MKHALCGVLRGLGSVAAQVGRRCACCLTCGRAVVGVPFAGALTPPPWSRTARESLRERAARAVPRRHGSPHSRAPTSIASAGRCCTRAGYTHARLDAPVAPVASSCERIHAAPFAQSRCGVPHLYLTAMVTKFSNLITRSLPPSPRPPRRESASSISRYRASQVRLAQAALQEHLAEEPGATPPEPSRTGRRTGT